jgi:hypothetical protein
MSQAEPGTAKPTSTDDGPIAFVTAEEASLDAFLAVSAASAYSHSWRNMPSRS